MKKLLLVVALLGLSACDNTPKRYTLKRVHVLGCAYCAVGADCSHGILTIQFEDGKIIQVRDNYGFKCEIYLNSTYWDLQVQETYTDSGDYKIVNRTMVK